MPTGEILAENTYAAFLVLCYNLCDVWGLRVTDQAGRQVPDRVGLTVKEGVCTLLIG